MPHTQSAKKRLRQNKKRREQNRYAKKGIKVQVKHFLKALDAGDKEASQKEYNLCAKKLDKAGARRILHPNKVSRKKAQLAKLLNAKLAGGESEAN